MFSSFAVEDMCYKTDLECNANARCINLNGSAVCKCNHGLHGDGTNCTFITF
jgi:hypothetical protein